MTTYEGTYNGQHYSSIHPHLYRVKYRAQIGGRIMDVDKIMTAGHEYDCRVRLRGVDIRGGISVERVGTLDAA